MDVKSGLSYIIFKVILGNKQKKWTFSSIIFFLVLSLDDYSVISLNVPPLNQANISEGFLQVVPARGGKRGGGDILFLSSAYHSEEFRCRINSGDSSRCITIGDVRFYDKKIEEGKVLFYTPKEIDKTKFARIWSYEASFFGPFKEKHLLQLDADEVRVISYEKQKEKYLLKKSEHGYIPTILFVISAIYLFLLQFINQPLNNNKEK